MDKIIDIKNIQLLETISRGSSGEIFKARDKTTGKTLAAKMLENASDDSIQNTCLQREIQILSYFSHPTILECFGYSPVDFNNENRPIIFTQFCPNRSLNYVIELERSHKSPPNWNDTKKLINIYGIAFGMMILHSHQIIHRDLKPANVLEDKNYYPKIGDFGFSKICNNNNNSSQTNVGTPLFMAPEIFLGNRYSNKIDVFSFAMTIYELICGTLRNDKITSVFSLMKFVTEGNRQTIDPKIPECYKNLISECWSQDPDKRPSFKEIVARLRTDPNFITDKVDEKEYKKYIKYIDEGKFGEEEEEEDEFEDDEDDEDNEYLYFNIFKGEPFVLDVRNINIKDYKKKERLGNGASGEVYKIKEIATKKIYAAKILKKQIFQREKNTIKAVNLSREVGILSKLNHPSIMRFFGYSPTDFINLCRPVIVTEIITNGRLAKILEIERSGLHITFWDDTMKLINIYGIASCMAYLHSLGIIHRDLKPENILVDEFLFPKLSDFGISKFITHQSQIGNINIEVVQSLQEPIGTYQFIAPEIWSNLKYTKASDVYAFAMIVYEIIEKEIPFRNKGEHQVMYIVSIGQDHPKFVNPIEDHYKELIEECWRFEPDERPSFEDIVHKLETDKRFVNEKINKKLFYDYIQYIKQLQQEETISFSFKSEAFKQYSLQPIIDKYDNDKIGLLQKGFINIDKYVKQNAIYQNYFSFFYYVIDKITGQMCSAEISKFDIDYLNPKEKESLSNEVDVLTHLKHPSIQQVIGYSLVNFKHRPKPVIIREYSANQTLFDIIENERNGEKKLNWNDTQKLIVIFGIASGMAYLHSNDVIHHELNTKNVFVDDDLKPKITEFGFFIKHQNTTKSSSESSNFDKKISYFISPEILQSKSPTKSGDVYSFAFIVYEIISNEIPFKNIKNQKQLFTEVVDKCARPSFNESFPENYRDLISSCWAQDLDQRPNFDSIVNSLKNEKFVKDKIDKKEFNKYIKFIENK